MVLIQRKKGDVHRILGERYVAPSSQVLGPGRQATRVGLLRARHRDEETPTSL